MFVRHLHVWDLLLILHLGRVHRKQVLSTRLLPISKTPGLEGGDTCVSQVLSLVLVLLGFLQLFPLLLGHTTVHHYYDHDQQISEKEKYYVQRKEPRQRSILRSFCLLLTRGCIPL